MVSSDLTISESEWQSLLSIKEYAKLLFDVVITRKDEFYGPDNSSVGVNLPSSPDHQGQQTVNKRESSSETVEIGFSKKYFDANIINGLCPPPVIVHIESKDSKNLEKCKKFLVACTPSNSDFDILNLKAETKISFEMVRAYSASIQQSTAALINLYPKQLEVTIQGHYSCVEAARYKVEMLLQDCKFQSCEDGEGIKDSIHTDCSFQESSNNQEKDTTTQNHILFRKSISPETTQTAAGSTESTSDGVDHTPSHYNLFSNMLTEENNGHLNSSSSIQSFENNLNLLRDEDENSSDSEEDNILTDERFKDHISQASKFGFSDEKIANVLKTLNPNSSINDMMQGLVNNKDAEEMNGEGQQESKEVVNSVFSSKEEEIEDEDFDVNDSSNLRPIVIDGSNVAMSHGQKVFSCLGIKIVVDWFKNRGHRNITVFVPQWRKEASRPDAPIANQEILTELEKERIVVFTPSRRVGGTRIVCYDDRYVLKLAVQQEAIVVSNDVYRDLVKEREDFKKVVAERLLMYSFVKDTFMPPEDPLGRQGPSLDNFLRIKPSQPKNKPQICPYGKKCTYGNKCRFHHPERRYSEPQKMVAEKLKENAEMKSRASNSGKSEASTEKGRRTKPKLSRTVSLLPQESVSNPTTSVGNEEKSKKPPLQHSKSLVFQGSYLEELRQKMEQAELNDVRQSFNSDRFDQTSNPNSRIVGEYQEVRKYQSSSCNVSPRTSPTPTNSVMMKNKLKAVASFPSSPALSSPAPIKASLNIPQHETEGRYLSGHLLVAKKLSDEENKNQNFFSQHMSRTPGSSHNNQDMNVAYSGSQLMSPGPSISTPLISQNQEEETCHSGQWHSQEIFLPPEISNETNFQRGSQDHLKMLPSTPYMSPKTENTFPIPSSNSEVCNSFPSYTPSQMPQHQSFQRSLSTHTPSKLPEYHPASQGNRKYSLNTSTMNSAIHAPPQPNQQPYLYPVNHHNVKPAPLMPFQRYQGSVDSGISSGLSLDQTPSPFPQDLMYSPFTSLVPNATTQQRNGRYQSGPSSFAAQGEGNSPYPAGHYQFTNPLQFASVSNNRMTFSPHDGTRADLHSSRFPMYVTSPYPVGPQAYPMQYPFSTQFQTSYPPPFVNPENSMPSLTTSSPDVTPKVIDEEAPINPNDIRYSTYYNLSSVFGEKVVRRFMNRNPDVTSPKDLMSLISSYKQSTGL